MLMLAPFFAILISMLVWGIWMIRAEFKSPSVQGDYTRYTVKYNSPEVQRAINAWG
jgi:hypothetical protein